MVSVPAVEQAAPAPVPAATPQTAVAPPVPTVPAQEGAVAAPTLAKLEE